MQQLHAESLNIKSMQALTSFAQVYQLIKKYYVSPVSDQLLVYGAINGMLHSLDSHSTFLDSFQFQELKREVSGRFSGFGLFLTSNRIGSSIAIVDSVIAGSPADVAGIHAHDVVVSLDGRPVKNMTTNNFIQYLRTKRSIHLGIVRDGKIMNVVITRGNVHVNPVKVRNINHIGYMHILYFNVRSASDVKYFLLHTSHDKGFVLDLRGNPGGLIDQAIQVAKYFLRSGEIVILKSRDPSHVRGFVSKNGDMTNGKPLVVLIDNQTASAAEILVGALQDHKRAVVMGVRSFGKGSVQTIFPIDNGREAIKLTTANYYTPSGRSIHGVGITPDIIIESKNSYSDRAFISISRGSKTCLKNNDDLMNDYLIYRAVQYITKIIS